MDEKTDLSPPTELLDTSTAVSFAEGIVSDVTGTSAGTNDVDGDREIVSNEPSEVSEPNEGGNDANNLLSELNDVSLTAGNSDADTFLDSLTSDNPDTPEVPPSQEESTQDTESTTMPALDLPMEVTPQSEDEITLKEEKNVDEGEQKGPVCSLEEELQRMHEGDDQLLNTEPESNKPKDEEKMVKETVGENSDTTNNAPIMRDSDLEEMLSADEVLQDSTSIKAAQDEIKRLDVLVCGTCHEVFNFVEEFQEHKTNKCTQKSNLIPICEFESKPQVWGYILWKNKKSKEIKAEEEISSWQIYKNWCSLAPDDQNAWISAGQTLQYYNKIGSAKLTEVKLHSKIPKDEEKDPLSLDNFGESNKENSSLDTTKSPLLEVNDPNSNRAMRTVQTAQKCEFVVEKIVAKRFNPKRKTWEYQIKWENFPSEDNTWEPIGNLNHCKQMVEEFEEQLKKLKAEKAKQQAANLAKNSPKQKPIILNSPSGSKGLNQNRPQRTSKQKALDQVKAWCGNISDEDNVDSLGYKRSRSPDSDESYEKRMKLDENSEDSESDVKPKVTYRKIAPKPTSSQPIQILKNGIGKNSPLPQNILIPDANGVVRINQKQLPSLSTGVYIMSKTAGIIKLDSNTSKVATSGGQTIVKVAPKIGQTQIKIMKKDGTSTQQIVQMSSKNVPSNSKGMKTHLARAKKIVTELKPVQVAKKTEVLKKPVILNTKESEKKMVVKKILDGKQTTKFSKGLNSSQSGQENRDDDSDDGLEELPFPDEIKVPEPEETEESEFTLDPTTGKIAGVEYPDIPDPEPIEEPSKSELSLDNIVKLAAADITEEDLKNEPQDAMELDIHHLEPENDEVEKYKMPIKTELESQKRFVSSPMKQVVKMSVTPRKVAAYPTSILNKALTQGPQVVRRNVTGQPSQRVQQRVLNQSVARSPQMTSPVVRQLNTYVRTKPVAPKPKFNLPGESKFIRPNRDSSPTKVYSYSRSLVQNQGAQRKIGSTTIRSSSMPIVTSPQSKTQSRLVKTSTGVMQRIVSPMKKESSSGMVVRGQPEKIERKLVQNKPKTVISMPSLISDDDLLIPNKATPQQKGKVAALIQNSEQTQEYHDQQQIAAVVQEANIGEAVAQEQQAVAALTPDMSSFTLADNENPIFITGDDGTVYQVAGQNEQGQTILLTQGSDGQQQCLLVTNEVAEAMDTSLTEEAQQPEISMPQINTDVTEPLSVKTDTTENNDQVVAQVVRAEPPSPGGTHKVVVMLPDGNLMVTQVSPEEYASLELE